MPNHVAVFLKTLSVAVAHNTQDSPEVMAMSSHDQVIHIQERNCVTAATRLTAVVKMTLTVRLISGTPGYEKMCLLELMKSHKSHSTPKMLSF